MPQTIHTSADDVATVSASPHAYQSIQTAIANEPEDRRIHVHRSYDKGEDADGVTIPHRRHVSADHGTKLPPVTLQTSHKRPPGALLEGFETPTLTVKGSKFATIRDVHTSPGGGGFRAEDTDALSCNSVAFVRCTADRPKEDGFFLDAKAHAARLRDCCVVGGGRYGVFATGAANVLLDGVQVEDCAEAGVKGQRSEALTVRHSYIEHNAKTGQYHNADLVLADCPGFCIGQDYFHALDETPARAIALHGDRTHGCIQRSHYLGYPRPPIKNRAGGRVSIE